MTAGLRTTAGAWTVSDSRTRVTFTARAFGGGQRGAIVNFAGRAVRTDSRGRGSLTVRITSSGKVNARVTKRGFRRTVLRVPVR